MQNTLKDLGCKIAAPFLLHINPPAVRYQAVMVRQGTALLESAGLFVLPVLLPGDKRFLYVSPLPSNTAEAIRAAYHETVTVHVVHGMTGDADREAILSQYVH